MNSLKILDRLLKLFERYGSVFIFVKMHKYGVELLLGKFVVDFSHQLKKLLRFQLFILIQVIRTIDFTEVVVLCQ